MPKLQWSKLKTPHTPEEWRNAPELGWLKLAVSKGFLILAMFTFSIGLVFYQRLLLQSYKFPLSIVTCHLIMKYTLAVIFRKIFEVLNGRKRVTLSWSTNFCKLAPVGFSAALDLGFSNWGLMLITVSLYTMTKSTAIVFILLFAIMLGLEKKTWSVFIIVFMISCGLFLFTFESTQFNVTGFILILLASMISGFRWTLTQFIMGQSSLDLKNPVDMMYHVQFWMFLLLAPIAYFVEGSAVSQFIFSTQNLFSLFILMISGGMIAFALEITEFLVILHTSSLTFAVSGILKETFTLILAYEWNGDNMTLINFMGLLMCLGGIICHVWYKAKHMHKTENTIVNDITSNKHNQIQISNEEASSPATVPFLHNYTDHEDNATNSEDEDSSSEIFKVLQIVDRPR